MNICHNVLPKFSTCQNYAKTIMKVSYHTTFYQLNAKTPIIINEDDLEEKFVKGGGKGGQHVNKTSNKVQLKHIPTGIMIQCHDQRDLHSNRKIARKLLKDKLDIHYNGDSSRIGKRISRIRRRKQKAQYRAHKKKKSDDNSKEDDHDTVVPPRRIGDGVQGWTEDFNRQN